MVNKLYYGEDINVWFDLDRCLHVGACLRGDPEVFDIHRRPWVMPDAGDADHIAEVVRRCPTGALHYEYTDPAKPGEEARVPTSVRTSDDDPVWVRGDLLIAEDDSETTERRAALCRCGSTGNKPYCDASGPCTGWRKRHYGK
jgi:uncharacterized Fe-S cluster protein YjdI